MKHKSFLLNISVTIILYFLILTGSIYAQIPYNPENPESFSAKSETRGIELVFKRTLRSKTFLNPVTNTVTVEINSGYLHYPAKSGRLEEIDRRILPTADSTAYEVTRGLYKARFGFDLDAGPIRFSLADSSFFDAQLTGLAYYDTTSNRLLMLEPVQKAQGQPNGSKIRYAGAFTGVDVEYTYLDTRLKVDAFLSQQARDNLPGPQKLGLNTDRAYLVLVSQYDIPDSLDAFANNDKVSARNPNGKTVVNFRGKARVDFRNSRGGEKFNLPVDVAYLIASGSDSVRSALDSESKTAEPKTSQVMWRHFYNTGNDNFVLTGVPYTWLVEQPKGTMVLDPTVGMQPDASEVDDTFIYKSNGGNDNHGGLTQLQMGPDRTSYERRGLIKFDLSAIPSTATISSATLKLYLFGTSGTANSFTLQAHEMLRSWVEGTGSSWNAGNTSGCDWYYADRPSSTAWAAGGMSADNDYDSSVLDSKEISANSINVWHTWDITSTAQTWVSTPANNYGVALITESNDISLYICGQFWSSDYSTASKRPILEITYTIDPLVTYSYDDFGRVSTVEYANGVIETDTYQDARGWLKKREYKQGATTLFFVENTVMDAVGNIKQQQYQHQGGALKTLNYDYDDLHQITEFKDGANVIERYNYDPNGNRTTLSGYGTFTYGNANNQLTSHNDGVTTKSYTFDCVGRVKQIDNNALYYDAFDNMTAYGSYTYRYNAIGQRVKKTEDGITKYYVNGGLATLAEYNGSGNLQAEYIYGLRGMIAQLDPSKGYLWLYTDHLGSTRHVDNATMQRDYTPFGETYTAAGNDDVPYQFTGKELDTGSGLHYFGARYFDRRIGRWLVPDPVRSDFSPYSYVGNKPLRFVDL